MFCFGKGMMTEGCAARVLRQAQDGGRDGAVQCGGRPALPMRQEGNTGVMRGVIG